MGKPRTDLRGDAGEGLGGFPAGGVLLFVFFKRKRFLLRRLKRKAQRVRHGERRDARGGQRGLQDVCVDDF